MSDWESAKYPPNEMARIVAGDRKKEKELAKLINDAIKLWKQNRK